MSNVDAAISPKNVSSVAVVGDHLGRVQHVGATRTALSGPEEG